MPTYHFHSANGGRFLDRDGIELRDLAEARLNAVQLAGEVLRDHPEHIWEAGHWRVEVTDHRNVLLFTVVTLVIDAPPVGAI